MSDDPWSYTEYQYRVEKVQVAYDRARKKPGGAIHLIHARSTMSLCGIKLGGRREGDSKPIRSQAEPTCGRCRRMARNEQAANQ